MAARNHPHTRSAEAHSLGIDEALTASARKRWSELPRGQQLQLAAQLADCLRSPLSRQYRNVVQVGAGLRRRRADDGCEWMHDQVCLVLLVKKKVNNPGPQQMLPREWLSPACVGGQPELVSVPIDVQEHRRLTRARAQAANAFHCQDGAGWWQRGAIGLLFSKGAQLWALAPIHVLSPQIGAGQKGLQTGALGQSLRLPQGAPGSPPMLQSLGQGGRLLPSPAESLDAQLARVLDKAQAMQAFAGLRLRSSWMMLRHLGELGDWINAGRLLEIHVPANHGERLLTHKAPLLAAPSLAEIGVEIDYKFAGGLTPVWHRVIELTLQGMEPTLAGDSGSPVMLNHGDGSYTFAGMHIGGRDPYREPSGRWVAPASFIIPAWRLFSSTPDAPGSVGALPTQGFKPWTG